MPLASRPRRQPSSSSRPRTVIAGSRLQLSAAARRRRQGGHRHERHLVRRPSTWRRSTRRELAGASPGPGPGVRHRYGKTGIAVIEIEPRTGDDRLVPPARDPGRRHRSTRSPAPKTGTAFTALFFSHQCDRVATVDQAGAVIPPRGLGHPRRHHRERAPAKVNVVPNRGAHRGVRPSTGRTGDVIHLRFTVEDVPRCWSTARDPLERVRERRRDRADGGFARTTRARRHRRPARSRACTR
jgi:hypothetical protein